MATVERHTILFTLVYQQEDVQVQTKPQQYYSLMSLISDYLAPAGFGLCSGMGGCGTCAVDIDGIRSLSCAVSINDELANTRIVILDASL